MKPSEFIRKNEVDQRYNGKKQQKFKRIEQHASLTALNKESDLTTANLMILFKDVYCNNRRSERKIRVTELSARAVGMAADYFYYRQ